MARPANTKVARNAEIMQGVAAGERLAALARAHGLSLARVREIVKQERGYAAELARRGPTPPEPPPPPVARCPCCGQTLPAFLGRPTARPALAGLPAKVARIVEDAARRRRVTLATPDDTRAFLRALVDERPDILLHLRDLGPKGRQALADWLALAPENVTPDPPIS